MTPEEKKALKRERDKKYRETHKEQIRERQKRYNEAHRAEANARNRAWIERNRETINERNRERYKANPEAQKERTAKYLANAENAERRKETDKKYQQQRIDYNRQKYKTDPKYRFRKCVWTLINKYMHKAGYTGGKKVWEVVGCDFETFLNHIQGQFENGMSLENYGIGEGKWNIDHIEPISKVVTNEDFERINHYTNLRPF